MRKKNLALMLLLVILQSLALNVFSQLKDTVSNKFVVLKELPATRVKNQYKSSTCWSFSVISMLETELIAAGKGEYDLSEMFVVRNTYLEKAERYVRMHGTVNFGGGGSLSDVIEMIEKYGIVPFEAYTGLRNGNVSYIHTEMDAALKSYVEGVVKNRKVSPLWKEGFIGILDAYLGKVPETFLYKGKEYSPKQFADFLGFKASNYLLMSSFCDKAYYEKHIVEVPDNWSWGEAYNLPLDEFELVVDNSINKGYSVAFAVDVSEKGFMWDKGMALADHDPEYIFESSSDPSMYIKRIDTTSVPYDEISVNPLMRQQAIDNYETTDDHGMQIIGLAKDIKQKKYYLVKNSWGTELTPYRGFLYVSQAYFEYKTLTTLVNKNAISESILKKLEKK